MSVMTLNGKDAMNRGTTVRARAEAREGDPGGGLRWELDDKNLNSLHYKLE